MSVPDTVLAMVTDPANPTAPLDDFLAAYREDDNWWWRIGCGHHQNLFEAAVDELRQNDAEAALRGER